MYSPEVGSSAMRIAGAATNSNPILSRLLSPPLIPLLILDPIIVSATSNNPSWVMISNTRAL